jgi:hypothetical protein
MISYNTKMSYVEIIPVTGAKGLSHTIAATAIADNGNGTVRVTLAAAHGLLAGSVVYIEGTTNYNGLREIVNVAAATTIDIRATYKAETPAGTETVKVAIVAKKGYYFAGLRLHLSAAPTTSENLTITLDSHLGAAWDTVIYSKDLATVINLVYALDEAENLPFHEDDILRVAWANTDLSTFGLELIYKPLQ